VGDWSVGLLLSLSSAERRCWLLDDEALPVRKPPYAHDPLRTGFRGDAHTMKFNS